jgi:acetyl esterase/lipase
MVNKNTVWVSTLLAGALASAETLVNSTFEEALGGVPRDAALQRAEQVSVVPGTGPIGTDAVVRFDDESTSRPGILEYNPGQGPAGAYRISFDLQNNASGGGGDPEPIIFSVGQWARGRGVALGANASRAFGLEFTDNSSAIALRIGKSAAKRDSYDSTAVQHVLIFVNDSDSDGLSYTRPDTQEAAVLNPDSVVVWVNGQLLKRESPSGVAMQSSVSQGNAVLGRMGFSSSTSSTVDFLIDDFSVESLESSSAGSPLPEPAAAQAAPADRSSDPSPQSDGTVYLHETFDSFPVGSSPKSPLQCRVDKVSVVDGGGWIGSGLAARFLDEDTGRGGALEYNAGAEELGSLYVSFDVLNNDPQKAEASSVVTFGVGQWAVTKSLMLNAKAKRAFGLELYGQTPYIKLRVGDNTVAYSRYDASRPLNVKIWVNDHDGNTLSYKRPDTGEEVLLNPDSAVVWINNALLGREQAAGVPMNKAVTQGDAVLGRLGFSSTTKALTDFLIDNVHIEDPSGASAPADPKTLSPSASGEVTPVRMAGAETVAYRDGDAAMNLFVYKPQGWSTSDKRSALVYFFGGGWTKGTPLKSASWGSWAAEHGMVGICPDYRTKNRFDTSPLASVADGRAAFGWIVRHAEELGIDPARIIVGGTSAGGHVAFWTALSTTPPGSDPAEAVAQKPAALFLSSAVTDTSPDTGYTPSRFGDDAVALSPVDQLDDKMPPVLMFHAVDDPLVHYSTAVALHDKLLAAGNVCDLITVPRGGHGFSSTYPEWKDKVRTKAEQFFAQQGLLPATP